MKRTTTIISAAALAIALAGGATYAAAQDTGNDGSITDDDLARATAAALAAAGDGTVTGVELDDGGYEVEVRLTDGTEIDVELDGDFTVVRTESDDADDDSNDGADADSDNGADSDDLPVGDAERQQAVDAALAEVGAGDVTDVEHDDGGYDVEVRLSDGTEIDVELDREFTVTRAEHDDD
jgi:uncharacterized membrane protein YkoI